MNQIERERRIAFHIHSCNILISKWKEKKNQLQVDFWKGNLKEYEEEYRNSCGHNFYPEKCVHCKDLQYVRRENEEEFWKNFLGKLMKD